MALCVELNAGRYACTCPPSPCSRGTWYAPSSPFSVVRWLPSGKGCKTGKTIRALELHLCRDAGMAVP